MALKSLDVHADTCLAADWRKQMHLFWGSAWLRNGYLSGRLLSDPGQWQLGATQGLFKEESVKSSRLLFLLALVTVWATSLVFAAPSTIITSIRVVDTSCYYTAGNAPCSIGPGMKIYINGSNFGKVTGVVTFCNCAPATIKDWSATRVTVIVNSVAPIASLQLQNGSGGFSNSIPYNPLGPVITSIVVGSCTYIPDWTSNLCKIAPGTQFTIYGSYFGPSTGGGTVVTCSDCGNATATINSWNPNWLANPSPYYNQIDATATQAICGSTIAVFADSIWSNYIPYTAC